MDQAAPPAIACTIQADRSAGRIALRGRIVAPAGARGAYRFEIQKTGPSGRSNISQGGVFGVPASGETQAGSATFDDAPQTHFIARLTLDADGRSYSCEKNEESL